MQTAFLGDVILSIPLFKALRLKFPDCKIALLCRKGFGEIFEKGNIVDFVIEVNKEDRQSMKSAFETTRLKNWDLIISPHRSFRTALWTWRLASKFSVGYSDFWNSFAFTIRIPRPHDLHDVLRQISLLEGLDIKVSDLPTDVLKLDLQLPFSGEFSDLKNAVALAPGSQWNTKRWTTKGYLEVAEDFLATGKKVVLFGSNNEKILCEELQNALSGKAINLCGATTVFQLAQALKQCAILVCNDSGTMHLATAVGVPVVSIFGPTVRSQGYIPWSKKSKIVEVTLPCRPCGAHGHQSCPIGTHDCMKKVSSQMVLEAASGFLR